MADYAWINDMESVDLAELSRLYAIAPLGNKPPDALATVFGNSRFVCFVYAEDVLIGAGRVLADGLDCAYIADVAVHPQYQRRGIGKAIIRKLVALAEGHKKIILYANPGTEGFYRDLGFLHMNTAMAIWQDPARAIGSGLLSTDRGGPLWLAPDRAELIHVARGSAPDLRDIRAPSWGRDDARLQHLEPGKELRDLLGAAEDDGRLAELVPSPDSLIGDLTVDDIRAVRGDQVTT